jgi:hypothetical protein
MMEKKLIRNFCFTDQNSKELKEFIKEALIQDILQMMDTTEEEHILLMFHQNHNSMLLHALPIIIGNACLSAKWL